jgi:two-component sensor histidine kinase
VLETRRNGLYGFQRRGLTCRVSQAFDFEIDFRIRKIGSERSEMFHRQRRDDPISVASFIVSAREYILRAITSTEGPRLDRLLVSEITHRVNNEFASVIQVVSLIAARSLNPDVKAALAGVMDKLHNYAGVHHALQVPANNDIVDGSVYLRQLCSSISRSKLETRGIELILIEQPFRMSAERCWVMGMIIVELITNAVRHAFDAQQGTIRVECLMSGGYVECRVSDSGSATTDIRRRNGLRIVDALAEMYDATFDLHPSGAGIEAVLLLPTEPILFDRSVMAGRLAVGNTEYAK